jgi:Putative MetA-pathway of phenol degradation
VRFLSLLAAFALGGAAVPALAGPPYQTDDPEPTELGHWETYNFVDIDALGGTIDGEGGVDLNYGAARGLQLTATLPIAFSHEAADHWRVGRGDVQLGAKYRFFNDEESGWEAAVFPRVILPTSAKGLGGNRVRLLLPLWVQKDLGKTSLFGGGGYEINPGPGNKGFWQAGLAVTHDFTSKLSLGAEAYWQAADTREGSDDAGLDVGLIRKLSGPFSLLLAGGPRFSSGHTGYHCYAALGLNF